MYWPDIYADWGEEEGQYTCPECSNHFTKELNEGDCFLTCPKCQHCWILESKLRD